MYRLVVESLDLSSILPAIDAPIQFNLQQEEIVSLSGPSGVGKSVLLKALVDLLKAPASIQLDNNNREQLSAEQWRQQVMLFPAQSAWWYPLMEEHFQLQQLAQVKEWMAELLLDEVLLGKPIAELSTGQKQRFSIIRGLLQQPKVLLLDEPTATLDPVASEKVEQLISHYCRANQAAVVWVSHDAAQCQRVASRHFQFSRSGLKELAA